MKTINVHQAETQLFRILEEVAAGEEVIIASVISCLLGEASV